MRFLGVTETCDLGALYLRLAAEGHEVRCSISEPMAQGTLAGMVPRVDNWRDELGWIGEAGADGIIVFEAVSEGFGALQDSLRSDGYQVVGGSAFGDRLENDRAFAQSVLADLGLQVAGVRSFRSEAAARRYIAEHPARYVLKFCGADEGIGRNYVGRSGDGQDVSAILEARSADADAGNAEFILMDHVEGVEMGVGAYFDGERFLRPACLDWEHKRFFAGDMGELTGEMGTVATFDRSSAFFERTLGRVAPLLRAHRHVGYVNLNTIVNEDGIWPLEFTCRFGYPGFAVLDPLQRTSWAELLRLMTRSSSGDLEVERGYSVGIVITTPPFPYSRKDIAEPVGLPIVLPDDFSEEDHRHVHFGEVGLRGSRLVTSGLYGWTMVVTGVGASVQNARDEAYARAHRIAVPNGRFRLDIGERLIVTDLERVERLGVLASPVAVQN